VPYIGLPRTITKAAFENFCSKISLGKCQF
jgi:hypothetical protein